MRTLVRDAEGKKKHLKRFKRFLEIWKHVLNVFFFIFSNFIVKIDSFKLNFGLWFGWVIIAISS